MPPLKEVYVELADDPLGGVQLQPYPLPAETDSRVFVAVRSLERGTAESREKLLRMLRQWPGEDGRAEDLQLDLSGFDPLEPPSLLFFPEELGARIQSGCYLGHASYPRPVFSRGAEVVHHLRLLVVNRLGHPLQLLPERCTLVGDDGVPLPLDAMANDRGERLEGLRLPASRTALVHLFYSAQRVDLRLLFNWELEVPPGLEDPPILSGPWTFQTRLARRYLIDEALLSDLEEKVRDREPLPEAYEAPDPWREPRMEPIGPADLGGGEAGGGDAGGGAE